MRLALPLLLTVLAASACKSAESSPRPSPIPAPVGVTAQQQGALPAATVGGTPNTFSPTPPATVRPGTPLPSTIPAAGSRPTYATIAPLVKAYCLNCHSQYAQQAGFDAEKTSIYGMVASGSMPSPGSPKPTATEKAAILSYTAP